MQMKAWLLREDCLVELKGMFYIPWYKAESVNKVRAMQKNTDVVV